MARFLVSQALYITLVIAVICQAIDPTMKVKYFRKYDHFESSDNLRIKVEVQIFSEDYESSPDSPLLVYLTNTPDEVSSTLVSIAKQLKGALLVLPTRYFTSTNLPMHLFSISNIEYLSVSQIIEDIREFVQLFKAGNDYLAVTSSNPIILIGKDFLGSVCYYSKMKYPNLFKGVITQDPILHTAAGFPEYDKLVFFLFSQFDQQCSLSIKSMVEDLEVIIKSNQSDNLIDFLLGMKYSNCQYFDKQCLEYISEQLYEIAESQNQQLMSTFCYSFLNSFDIRDKVATLIDISNQLHSNELNTTKTIEQHKILQMWLSCTQFGLFPTANSSNNIQSKLIDIQYFKEKCIQTFSQTQNFIKFDFAQSNSFNTEVGFFQNTLLISTNSLTRLAIQAHDPKGIITIPCEKCDHKEPFAEPRDYAEEVIIKVKQSIIEWIQSH